MTRRFSLRRLVLLLAAFLLCLPGSETYGQCSDAGACTIGRHAEGSQNVRSHSVGFRYLFGKSGSPENVTYHSVAAEAGLQVFSNSRLTVTLPFNRQSGPFGFADGLGDVIALWDQRVAEWGEGENRLQLQGGLRLATGKANANSLLSMGYQPGLGANDVILGTSLHLSNWSGGAAYQIAGGRNDHPLIRLKRGDQLVAWSNYAFAWEKTELAPGIMIVKQLNASSILDLSSSVERFISVPNSDQIQVNLALRVRQELTPSIGAELFAAFPLREREVDVDGLKRSLALSIGVLFNL